jgi:hypothetical protein
MPDVPKTSPQLRQCGGCTLCCKLMGVRQLGKPAGAWCVHCECSTGCAIYETRPEDCRIFNCGYLYMPNLDERWKPAVCKFVLSTDETESHMKIVVDPDRPDAGHKEPYYSAFKSWACVAVRQGGNVLVEIGKRVIAILPDQDVDLGVVEEDDRIVEVRQRTPTGYRYSVLKLHKSDPRVREAERVSTASTTP